MKLYNKEMLIDSMRYLDFIAIDIELERLMEGKEGGQAVAYVSLKDGNIEYRYEKEEVDESKNALVEIIRKYEDKDVFNVYMLEDIETLYKSFNSINE